MTDQELAQNLTEMAVRSMPPASDILSEAAYRLTKPDDTASKVEEILLRVRRLTPDLPKSLQC